MKNTSENRKQKTEIKFLLSAFLISALFL